MVREGTRLAYAWGETLILTLEDLWLTHNETLSSDLQIIVVKPIINSTTDWLPLAPSPQSQTAWKQTFELFPYFVTGMVNPFTANEFELQLLIAILISYSDE